MTPYTVRAELDFWATFADTGVGPALILTNDQTPSKSTKATNYRRFLAIVNYSISLLFVFACKRCPDGFSAVSAKGLKQHQKKCKAFIKRDDDTNQRRKATAASSKVKRAKLKDRKMRLNSAAPEVSLFVTIDKYHG
jgi:hypothetical protein